MREVSHLLPVRQHGEVALVSLGDPMTEGDDATETPPPSFAGPGPAKSTSPFVPNRQEVSALKEHSVRAFFEKVDTGFSRKNAVKQKLTARFRFNENEIGSSATKKPHSLAQTWIGTPYQHQASLKGIGCDCIGLIRGVWRELYGDEPIALPAYSPDWAEVGGREVLLENIAQHFTPIPLTEASAGDVLVFRMKPGAVAKHAAILLQPFDDPRAQIIHAYWGHAVVASWFKPFWQKQVVAAFRFPSPCTRGDGGPTGPDEGHIAAGLCSPSQFLPLTVFPLTRCFAPHPSPLPAGGERGQ